MTLDDWMATLVADYGLDGALADAADRLVVRDLVLDLAKDAAHGVARPAAPLTTFLAGLAAGRAGGSLDDVRAAVAQAAAAVPPPTEP